MRIYEPVEGIISNIEPIRTGKNRQEDCCNLFITLQLDNRSIANFTIDNTTYFIDQVNVKKGDSVTAFYDSRLPVIMIYPPQYRAVVIARRTRNRFVTVAKFNRELVSDDGSIRLNISDKTRIVMRNGQSFLCGIEGKHAAVVYSVSTKSYPAVTSPSEVIVLCN